MFSDNIKSMICRALHMCMCMRKEMRKQVDRQQENILKSYKQPHTHTHNYARMNIVVERQGNDVATRLNRL